MSDEAFEQSAEQFERKAALATQSCCSCEADLGGGASSGHEQIWFALKRGGLTQESIKDANADIELGLGPSIDAAIVEPWFQFKTVMCSACEEDLQKGVAEAAAAVKKIKTASGLQTIKIAGLLLLVLGPLAALPLVLKEMDIYVAPVWLGIALLVPALCALAYLAFGMLEFSTAAQLDFRDLAMYPNADGRERFHEAHKRAVTARLSGLRKDTEFLKDRVAKSLSPLVFIKPGTVGRQKISDKVGRFVRDGSWFSVRPRSIRGRLSFVAAS